MMVVKLTVILISMLVHSFSFDICQLVFLHNKLQTGLFCCWPFVRLGTRSLLIYRLSHTDELDKLSQIQMCRYCVVYANLHICELFVFCFGKIICAVLWHKLDDIPNLNSFFLTKLIELLFLSGNWICFSCSKVKWVNNWMLKFSCQNRNCILLCLCFLLNCRLYSFLAQQTKSHGL